MKRTSIKRQRTARAKRQGPVLPRRNIDSRPAALRLRLAVAAATVGLCFSASQAELVVTTDTTGSGGTLTVSPPDELVVSGPANPLLTLTNGAVTSGVEGVVIGTSQSPYGSSGRLRIEAGSTLTNSGTDTNTGTYGGVDVLSGRGYLGLNTGSTGTATVTGVGSTWTNVSALHVGYSGTGTLNVEAGGHVSNNFATIGSNSSSTGTATVTGGGSTWTNNDALIVGQEGTGTLNVAAGGQVNNFTGYIGAFFGSTGTATVTGGGSTWNNSAHLYVGYAGAGTLNVEAGGQVSNFAGYIGLSPDSISTATVTGGGSTWTNSDALTVGSGGTGTLNVEAGGQVSNTNVAYIGITAGSTGTATVTGVGSTWTNSGTLYVGYAGAGTLNVEAGGQVSNTTGYISRFSDSTSTATVTGSGSTWTNSGDLILSGSDLATQTGGAGTLSILDGGLVSVAGTTRVHGGGQINLQPGGTLQTGVLDPTNGVFNWTGGTLLITGTSGNIPNVLAGRTLGGTGTITHDLVSAGTIAPGLSAGTLNISGHLTSSGTIAFEIAGLLAGAEHDVLNVAGDARLGGTLAVILDGYAPQLGDSFTIMSFGSLIDEGYAFDFTQAALGDELFWDTGDFATTGALRVVPEPASLGLLAAGGLMLARRRRR